MTTIRKWLCSPLLLGPLVILFAALDLVLLGRANDLSKSDWASWVQAIGSIAAIIAAFAVANMQLRHARLLDAQKSREDHIRRIKIVRAVLYHVQNLTTSMSEASARADCRYFETFNWLALLDLEQSLKSIPVIEVPSAVIVLHTAPIPNMLHVLARPFQRYSQVGYNFAAADRYQWLIANNLEMNIEQVLISTRGAIERCDEEIELITAG